jgi:hypothetical protein
MMFSETGEDVQDSNDNEEQMLVNKLIVIICML